MSWQLLVCSGSIATNENGLALWLHSAFCQASNKSIIKKQKFMKQKKDEQRSVELEQNLNSTTKADDTTSSSHNAKPNVGGRAWKFVKQLPEYQLWTADYWCPDNDGIELYISNDNTYFELSCFSGIGQSKIVFHDIEFVYLQGRAFIDFKEPFYMQCVRIADYFCRLFCEFKDVSEYKTLS